MSAALWLAASLAQSATTLRVPWYVMNKATEVISYM